MRMSSARAAEASRTAPPRLQRQASVLHEIQETQEKENLETRYTRLMNELAAVCEDRNQVLTPESLEYLASVGRSEPIKLEREPEKVAEIAEKGGKHDDLLSADAARRQRVEELTRFFMEAKSDIEFALGGREFREGRDKDRDGESEREEERGNETGDDDDDAVKGDETGDPATDAAILHHRLLKDKIDERVYNVMLSQLREQDAALYGAILCHPLVTGVDAKKDRRTKKKRKDRERKDKSQASSPVSSMLSPDFSSPALSDDEMKQNISRFVARAIADKSLQGLLLASKLILSWLLQPAHVANGALELPVASHLRVLRGEKAPEFPKPSVTVTSAREVNLSASIVQDDRLSDANIVSESGATMDVDELHVVSEVGLPSTMDVDNEGEASITARDQLTRFGEVGVDHDSGDEEDGADIDGAESADDEGVDEDALMARAIALSLSPEMNQTGGDPQKTEDRGAEASTPLLDATPPRPKAFSPDEITALAPFLLPNDTARTSAVTVALCLLAEVNKMCLEYLESCQRGLLPANSAVQPHPLTFMLISSVSHDLLGASPAWLSNQESAVAWRLFKSCSMFSVMRALEAHLFHVEVIGMSPASVGLGQFASPGVGDQPELSNKLVGNLKNLVERCIEIDVDGREVGAEKDPIGSVVFARKWSPVDVEDCAKLYEAQVRESGLASWVRSIIHFYPSQSSRHELLMSKLQDCLSVQVGKELKSKRKFHELDLLCARLSLPDLAQQFIPPSGDVIMSGSEDKTQDNAPSTEQEASLVDDSAVHAATHKPGSSKMMWKPDSIRRSLEAGSLSTRCLFDYIVENGSPEVDGTDLTASVLTDARVFDILTGAYTALQTASKKEEQRALECVQKIPHIVDLLRESVLRGSWPNFSFTEDYTLVHAPLSPLLEGHAKEKIPALNPRIMLLRAIQDFMIQRISGSRGDEPPALEFDPTRCAETMTLSEGHKTARQYTPKQWGMVMATTGCPPNSGTHEWAVRLDRCEKGHIFLGVCTRDASVATYVGGDRQGWGLIGTRALWHNRSKVRGDYGDGFSTGSIVRVRLNTDTGALSFGVDDSDWGIAFDGLTQHGTLYPAIGLYQRDDQVTILPVRSSESLSTVQSGGSLGIRDVTVPAILHPLLHHSAAVLEASCHFLAGEAMRSAIKQAEASKSANAVKLLIDSHPLLYPLVVPLISGLSVAKRYHGLSSVLALQFIPWCTRLAQLLDSVNDSVRKISSHSSPNLGVDVSGEWELKSMAAGNIPAQQYRLNLTQEPDGAVSGRSSGSFTTVTLTGAVIGTKVRFVETWRQGGTCLVEGRLRVDGNSFSGCYEDAKSHTSGNIVGHKVKGNGEGELSYLGNDGLLVLEVICANLIGYFSRSLIDCSKPDLIIDTFSTLPASEEEIVADGPSSVDADGTAKLATECSGDEYEGWVNSLLLSGGLPSAVVTAHLGDVVARLATLSQNSMTIPQLSQASDEWFQFVSPKAAKIGDRDSPVLNGSSNDFLQDLINTRGSAAIIDRWVSRHVGESPFLRLGGEPMKVAKRTVCAAMIWHSGFLTSVKKIAEATPVELIDSEQRPHENLMHIWRAAQRVIEWGIRAKNSMGSSYAVIAALVIRKAQFLLGIEPSSKAVAASVAVSALGHDGHANSASTKSAVYECAERIYSEVLMQVSRFLEAPIRISSLQSRMLAHSTKAFLRVIGMMSFRYFAGDASGGRGTLSSTVHSSFALSTLIQWLSSSAVEHPGVITVVKETTDGSETNLSGSTADSNHYLNGLGGCGKYLKNDLHDAFEALYGYLSASLSKATWAHDVDLQLVILEAWGIIIQPDDHAFLSRVGVFRVLQTVLDEARSADTTNDVMNPEERMRSQDSRRRVVQATLKVVHLLAAQVAQAGEVADSLIISPTETTSSGQLGMSAIPLLRKPSGPETLGKSVFHMLYTELKNALEELREGNSVSNKSEQLSEQPTEPTEAEPNNGGQAASALDDDVEEYCYQICSLLYSVSGSPVCRSHLSSSRWLRLLLLLLQVDAVQIQRRTLKLLRRLLPELDPTTVKLSPSSVDGFDADSDDGDEIEDADDHAASLIRFFMKIIGTICPPSLAEVMLRKLTGDGGIGNQDSGNTEVSTYTNSLAGEVVLLLRSLYKSPKWATHLALAVVSSLSSLPTKCVTEGLHHGAPADSDVEMEDTSRDMPSIEAWKSQNASYLDALSALCIIDGHTEGLHVGGTVKILPKSSSSSQEISLRGARGIIISYEPEKAAAEVLIRGSRGGDSAQQVTSSSSSSRPIRIPVDDLLPVPEVELDTSAFADEVLSAVLVEKFTFFVDEIKKSLDDLKATDLLKADDGNGGIDDDDDMSNDGSSTPSAMDSEMAISGGAESDVDSDPGSPHPASNVENQSESADVHSEMEKESKLHRMLLCQHGMRATALLLRDERAATAFIRNGGSHSLRELLKIATSETPTAGLGEIGSLEESWMFLWARWFSMRQASAYPTPDVSSKSSSGAESAADDAPNASVQQMMEMGFPKEWCEVALARCSQNVEAAINFCFEHSNDMERLVTQHKGSLESAKEGSRSRKPDAEAVNPLLEQLAEMGFPLNWCKKALVANRNNVDAALTWILSNGEALEAEDRRDEEAKQRSATDSGVPEPVASPAIVKPNPLRAVSGQASIGETDMMVEGLVGGGFASVGAPDCLVSSGRWYYEATLHTNGCIQIGWADIAFCGAADRGDGVGDGANSWAYDGWRQQKWHGQSSSWGSKWKQGDVIGCSIDVDAGTIIFSLNGKMKSANMGVAFRGIKFAHGVYPCASFNRRERLQFNLGGSQFKYQAPPGFRPIIEVLCSGSESVSDLPTGFGVLGRREDCLEEAIGEENYVSDARYFGRDLHASMTRSSGSHSRSANLIGSSRADMLAELKAIPDDRLYLELLVLTRSLAILHARRALLTLLAKWPGANVGDFSIEVFLPAQTNADAAAACETTTTQFIDFVKLVGGLSNSAMGVSQSRSAEVDELLDHGACGRQGLSLILDVARSALDRSLVASPSISPVHQASFVRVFVARISNEVKLASQRQYARVPWDSGDVSVTASLVQISSESGQAWSDSEVVKHPNLFLVEWMSRLLMDSLSRYHGQLEADNHHQLRTELLKAWLAALKSPGMCVKEKAFVIISGILQDMLLMSSSKGDIESSDMKNLIERVLEALSLPRLVDLAEERLLKEYSQLPICSRYVQSVVELVAAGSLATNLIGQSTDALFFRDVTKSLAASTQLENDMFAIDAKEYEDAQERKRQLIEEAEIRAKEAANAKQEEQSAADETADEQMQDDGAASTLPESNNDTNMDVDSDNEDTSDITLSAIANMVAEDSDVVAAAAAIAAASKGHLIIKDPSETSNPEGKPASGDFEYTFPDEKIVFDTSMLDSREIEMLEAGSRGILGDESLQWHYGSELGIMSDTKTSIWSGQVTQFKLPTGNSEVNIPELSVGCKVIRGPNWKWRDQDGGEGSIGTVEGVSPWSGVEGEGMSVRWPNDSLYTYRWGADGNYDLIHVEVSEEGLITKHYPTPKTKSDDEGTFGCELHLGVLIHLFEDSRVWKDGARKVNGVMEWPDFGAAVLISGVQYPDSTLCIQEIQMTRGNPDMGWFLRFGTEAWQPGTKYILRPVMSESNSELVGSTLQGEYSHMARRNGSLVEMRGEVRVSTKHLFTMDPYNHFSTLAISDGGMTVTCNSGESRNLALGTVGFATGVHYWEVRVDQAEFGSVFIGVCEKAGPPGSQAALSSRLNRWHGWGFVNFRATYHNSTERIYGDHFNAGDTIGVRLDMEQGKLSFFMDGMKFGEHIVADLGVAFDNLKGERNSRTLYPCIGMRKSGDRVALNGKWVSLPGVSPRQLLRDAIDVSSSLHSWYLSLHAPKPTPVKISESLLREAWREWKRWSENRWQRYPVRPRGVLVDFDTYPSSCIEVSKQAGLAAPFLTGDRVRICAKYGRELNQPEEAVVLGVYRGYLWYRTETQGNEGADEGRSWAWYFTPDELSELLLVKRNGKDMTLIENSATDLTESMASEVAFTPQSDAEAQAHSSFEAFANLATSSHTPFTDMQFVDRLNTFCAAIGVDVTNLKIGDVTVPIEEIEKSPTPSKRSRTHSFIPDGYFSAPLLKAITGPELRARCALLRVLNGKISRALPMIALQPTEPTIDVIEVAKSATLLGGQKSAEYPSSSLKLRSLRRLVFTSTKRAFWDAVLRSTTTNTPLPSDEYEDPREIRVIRINRIQAQPSKLSLLAQPSDRLRRSVFGQLYREMRTWNDSSFRRAYCGKGHGGQRRAFKVKFLGEGVNDYGGPYRAVFEQIVDELQMDNVELSKGEQGLLPLLIPCPNRRSGTGSNQDKFLLNPSCGTSLQSSGPMALDLHRFLGKIIGTGVRHGLQMGLDLPSLVWRPLAGLDVNRAHLESVDVVAANNLTRAEECSQENAHDILDYLNFTITLSDGSEVPLCQNGDALQVSLENRALYIRLAETTRLTESAQQLAALRDGLAAVLPMELASLFTPRELEVLICGRREVDVDLLQQCTEYGEGIDESMPHVEAFWEVLKEMSSDERTSFLRFVWARSRMPNSAKDFPMNFKIQTAHDSGAQVDPDKYLPHAQTCFFALRLPNYTSKDILRDKLLYAIQNSPNMDADVRLHNAEGWADA